MSSYPSYLELNDQKYEVYNLTGEPVAVYLKTAIPQPPYMYLESRGEIKEAKYDQHKKVGMRIQMSTSIGKLPVKFELNLIEMGTVKYMTDLYPVDLAGKAIIVKADIAKRLVLDKTISDTAILVQTDEYTLECHQLPN